MKEIPIDLSVETDRGPPVRVVFSLRDRGTRRGVVLTMRPRSAAGVWAVLGAAVQTDESAETEVTIRAQLEITGDATPTVP
jgi:hypothetical protein